MLGQSILYSFVAARAVTVGDIVWILSGSFSHSPIHHPKEELYIQKIVDNDFIAVWVTLCIFARSLTLGRWTYGRIELTTD